MDEHVLRGIARWPNVPAVYGWLGLDRRGTWLLQGEPISNPIVTAYIGRNYERDAEGRWFFQNGPQRVFVELAYTPCVYRALNPSDAPLSLETHTGSKATALSGAWIDEDGALLVETERGIGVVHDRDLDAVLASMTDAAGDALDEDALEAAMERLQRGSAAPLRLRLGASDAAVGPVRSADVPARFSFVARPTEHAPVAPPR